MTQPPYADLERYVPEEERRFWEERRRSWRSRAFRFVSSRLSRLLRWVGLR